MIRKIIAALFIIAGLATMGFSNLPYVAWLLVCTGLGFYGWALASEEDKRKHVIDQLCKGV